MQIAPEEDKVVHIRDLGVITFESYISFSLCIKNICNQSFKLLGFISRNTKLDAYVNMYIRVANFYRLFFSYGNLLVFG